MKLYALTLAGCLFLAACSTPVKQEEIRFNDINFTENNLYPEGTGFNSKENVFLVSSLRFGKIGKVDLNGNYTLFIDDSELISAIGIYADNERNLLYVASSDPGVSVKTSAETQTKHAKLGVYDLTTGERKFIADLGALNTEGANFANDIALDPDGNIYVTNSFSPIIYKVTQRGEASIFATNQDWTGEGFNLNGITYLSDGYLLVNQANNGAMYKVEIANPTNIIKVEAPAIAGADGFIKKSDTEIAVISFSQNQVFLLNTTDNWATATIAGTVNSIKTFPTTGVFVNGNFLVLNAKLDELFAGGELSSDFVIQKVDF